MKLSSVSFFCPAYNDAGNLPELIPTVSEFLSKYAEKYEIVIIEDGSPDKTGEVADDLATKYPNVRVIHHIKNLGYGRTLKHGFLDAKYDYVMYTDGDNQYNVKEFGDYLSLLGDSDILHGYVTEKAVSTARKIQSSIFNFIVKVIFFTNVKDVNCSMKIYKKEVLNSIKIESNSAFIDAEMILKAKRKGFNVAYFPVTHYERATGLASGSKPNIVIGTIIDMIKFRFGLL